MSGLSLALQRGIHDPTQYAPYRRGRWVGAKYPIRPLASRTSWRAQRYDQHMSLLDFFARQEGKALPPHPALMDNGTPIEILDLGSPSTRRRGPISQTEAKR